MRSRSEQIKQNCKHASVLEQGYVGGEEGLYILKVKGHITFINLLKQICKQASVWTGIRGRGMKICKDERPHNIY